MQASTALANFIDKMFQYHGHMPYYMHGNHEGVHCKK